MAKTGALRSGAADPAEADGMPPLRSSGGGPIPTEPAVGSGSGGGLTRVTVNLNRQAVHALEAVSDKTGYSKTDTINRALQIYEIIQEIMDKNGGVLQIKHGDGEVERIHIV